MCGRYTLIAEASELAAFGIAGPIDLKQRYNIAPS